jgi:adenosylmethionine---8-amino-7-oxononanoate aminotransferase
MEQKTTEWLKKDHKHVWHPCSQMKDHEQFPPMMVKSAKGSLIELTNGEQLIDATSSWWCKLLGHGHPRLKAALYQQAEQFEHVMLANTSNETIVRLSERLAGLMPNLEKVVYASDGACAVEMAMKMSLHARKILGDKQRHQFMSLSGDYHGETCGALAVSDLGRYRKPYEELLIASHFLQNIPYVSGQDDPLWSDCSAQWPAIENQLALHADQLTAILVEPIVQGANGMLIYSADFLRRLSHWAKQNDIHFIADEIMTGFGRTGKMLACEHADIQPDFLCLGKGLTGGWLPLSAVVTTEAIYDLFYDDYEMGKSFLHSHTYAGNALSAAVSLAMFDVMAEEQTLSTVNDQACLLRQLMEQTAEETGQLTRVRSLGAIVAADLIVENPQERKGYAVFQAAVKRGVLLRPLGNTVYWTPPLNISRALLAELQSATTASILACR